MPARSAACWIDGAWRPAASEHEFELAARCAPFGPRGRWPRCSTPELEASLEAAARAQEAWQGLARDGRLAVLLASLDALGADGEVAGELARGLGQPVEVVAERLEDDLLRAREALEILRDGGPSSQGTGLFQAHWSDLVGPLLARLAGRLAAGSAAVLVSDARLPEAAQALGRALERGGLPPGVVALLHDDGRTVLRAGMLDPRLAWVRLREDSGALEALTRGRSDSAFGAGLTEWSLWPLASAVHLVLAAADPAEEAARVVERGLVPSATLCGQLPDAIARVLCHQRQLSRFTEELLARLDARAELARPLVPVEPDLHGWMREAWSLGLDEGACPIFGESPAQAAHEPDPGPGAQAEPGLPSGSEGEATRLRRGRAPRAIRPVVFTNVEAGGRLLRLERPAPLLRLVRVASDEEARRLRDELALAAAGRPAKDNASRAP